MNTKQLLGLLGSIVLFIGVFAPIMNIPIIGSMNYFQNGKGDGTIVLVLAAISVVLVLAREFRGLWFTGVGSLGILLFTFINFQSRMSQATADLESQLAGNPFRGLADLAMQSVQLQWGWALLIVGAVLVIASAAMKDESPPQKDLPRPGKPPTNDEMVRSRLIDLAVQKPRTLGYPFELWTLDRLRTVLEEREGIRLSNSTIWTWLDEEGLEWNRQE